MTVFEMLSAEGPAPQYVQELSLYGRLVGSWAIECEWYSREGETRCARGSWHFGWILGGMGVQDVLYADDSPAWRRGTTLRCFDPGAGVWHVCWMQPSAAEFVSLVGKAVGEDIVQEALPSVGEPRLRWSFRDITPEAFTWLGEVSDDGETWFLEQRMLARRTGVRARL
jgi:hypothetical protein